MKKYIYLSILTCILTVFGCENDFDAKIYGSLSTTNFPQSEADYESYMMDCYIPFTLTWLIIGVAATSTTSTWPKEALTVCLTRPPIYVHLGPWAVHGVVLASIWHKDSLRT